MDTSIILQSLSEEKLFSKLREIISEEINKQSRPKASQEYKTKKEVATQIRSSLPTVDRLTASGVLKGYRVGRRILYKSDEVEQSLKEIHTLKYKHS